MNHKKILYVGGFELPDKNAAAHRVLANGKILNALGHEVFFMGVSISKIYETDVLKTASLRNYGTDYKVTYPDNKIDWFRYLSNVTNVLKIIEINNIDTIIAYNYPALQLYKLFKYCKKNNIKLISDCTEWEISNGGILFRAIKNLDTYFRMKIIQPKLNGIIAISGFLFNYYSAVNRNVIFVPPLIDKSDPKWEIDKIEAKNNKLRTIIYAGRPGHNKDFLGKIIQALIILKKSTKIDFLFEIMGITLDEYNFIWKDAKLPDEMAENIKFHGKVSNSIVIQRLKEVDFSIFIREDNLKNRAGFPTKFVESFAAGTPVLTNKLSDISQFLDEGKNGFYLNISSNSELSKSIETALSLNRSDIDIMKKKCSENFKFNYEEYISEFQKLIKDSNQ